MHLSYKISLTGPGPRLWSIEDIFIGPGIYVLKSFFSVHYILEKIVSMQHSFEEFLEKQRRVELKSVENFLLLFIPHIYLKTLILDKFEYCDWD